MVVALARCASAVFWRSSTADAMRVETQGTAPGGRGMLLAALLLLGSGLVMVLFAHPVSGFLRQTAAALGAT